MKKIILYFLAVGLMMNTYGQTKYVRAPSFAIHLFGNDFQTAADIRTFGFSTALKNYSGSGRLKPGVGFSYIQGLAEHLDFVTTASGSFVDYPVPDKPLAGIDKFLLEVAATVNVKITYRTDILFLPLLLLVPVHQNSRAIMELFIPVGVGLQLNPSDDFFILLNSQYRMRVTESVNYHFYHSIGFGANLFPKKEAAPKTLPVPGN